MSINGPRRATLERIFQGYEEVNQVRKDIRSPEIRNRIVKEETNLL